MMGITLLLVLILLFILNVGFRKSTSEELQLWMTHDEVLKVVPHARDKMERSVDADAYMMNEEEKKCIPVFRLDLELEYGLILGFNEDSELVLINRVLRARDPHVSE